VIGLNIAEGIAGLFARSITQWLPFTAGNALSAGEGGGPSVGGGFQSGMDAGTALVIVVVWLVVALGIAAFWTERAEIGG
jgi:hypothetical protein